MQKTNKPTIGTPFRTLGFNPATQYPYVEFSNGNVYYGYYIERMSNCGTLSDFIQKANDSKYRIKLTEIGRQAVGHIEK